MGIFFPQGGRFFLQFRGLLQQCHLRYPKFSNIWIKSFMKRNPNYVKHYIKEMAQAFCKYGESLVFNMDETSVRINNDSNKTIGRIGLEEITINAKRNSKECFTTIVTCSLIEKW